MLNIADNITDSDTLVHYADYDDNNVTLWSKQTTCDCMTLT